MSLSYYKYLAQQSLINDSSISDNLLSVKNTVVSQGYNINALNTHTQAIDSTITGMQRYLDNNITATQNVQSQANTNTANISALQTSVASNTAAINNIQTTTTNRLLGELVLIRKPTAWNTSLPVTNLYVKNGVHYQILTSTNVVLSNDSRYNDYAINYRGGAATIWMIQPQVPPTGYIYLEVIYCP